jgi:hypothetical protein
MKPVFEAWITSSRSWGAQRPGSLVENGTGNAGAIIKSHIVLVKCLQSGPLSEKCAEH